MSDQELRDKLASEFWDMANTNVLDSVHATTIFKAGWEAARANENRIILKPETGGTYTVTAKLTTSAEVERDQLKAQCEKLAEALEFVHTILMLTHPQLSDIEVNTLTTRQYMIWDRSEHVDALAEYRKQFPKDKE